MSCLSLVFWNMARIGWVPLVEQRDSEKTQQHRAGSVACGTQASPEEGI